MKTTSINVMNLCVPCENRCRYCLLSYDGKVTGVDYSRSEAYARRFYDWLKEKRPGMGFLFGFGYSMEHPELLPAIDFLNSIGSPTGEFLQLDGLKFRSDDEIREYLTGVKEHGVKLIDLTFYGVEEYHDRFAGRRGDWRYMMRILGAANELGLEAEVSLPLTHENAGDAEVLLRELDGYQLKRVFAFIPHGEGRGATLEDVRFRTGDLERLGDRALAMLNRDRFRSEKEWIASGETPSYENRVLTVTLRPDNIAFFESLSFDETIRWLEEMDDLYYNTIPPFESLVKTYGDPSCEKFYSLRDLFLKYQRRYMREQGLEMYDVNDERNCFSRRY